jgi:hypothetical protein
MCVGVNKVCVSMFFLFLEVSKSVVVLIDAWYDTHLDTLNHTHTFFIARSWKKHHERA